MNTKKAALAALAVLCLSSAHVARAADPEESVYTPEVEEGELELELKAGAFKREGEKFQGTSASIGYGVTDWWATEFGLKYHKAGSESFKYDAWEWENRFLLTPAGKYWLDLGLLLEIEKPRASAEGWEVKYGALLQKDIDKWQVNANFLFERHVRAEEPGVTEFGYQWQAKYRDRPALEFGLQGIGELGKWNDWAPGSEQSHRAGPAVFGKFRVGNQTVRYDVALLLPLSDAAPRNSVRGKLEFEF